MYKRELTKAKISLLDYEQIKMIIRFSNFLTETEDFRPSPESSLLGNYILNFILSSRDSGVTVKRIAGWLGISVRTVYRFLEASNSVSYAKRVKIFERIRNIEWSKDYENMLERIIAL